VVEARPLPGRFASPPNPTRLTPNIAAFERLLAHKRKAPIIWSHLGWDNTGQRTVDLCNALLLVHPNLYMALRVAPRAASERSMMDSVPVDRDGALKAKWLALIKAFPDRFLIGSDEFFPSPRMRMRRHPSTGSTGQTVKLLDSLPPALARAVAHENAERLFRLPR
jgi:predicted TIM-barrel fold metal-dependent hydrolase